MKNKRILILVLQFVLMLASVGGIIYYMNSQTDTTQVYVYTKTFIEPNQVIAETDIRVVEVPTVAINDNFAKTSEEIVGKFINSSVNAGQYVYKAQLVEGENVDVFETMDLSEYRMISLPIDMIQGLSGSIQRGDLIDLVYTGTAENQSGEMYGSKAFTYSSTFMQKVLVYSVNTAEGYLFDGYADIPEGGLVDEEGETVTRSALGIITLAVKLPQAEEIYARNNTGNISFVGRFKQSEDTETLGYAIGEYDFVFTGEAPIELHDIEEYNAKKAAEQGGAPVFEIIDEEAGN